MLWILLSVLIIVLDQISKYIVVKNIDQGHIIPVIDKFFYLTHYKNSGAAWGILQNGRLLFLIMIPVISAVIVYFMAKKDSRFLRVALAIILGGAAGNYIDRLFAGNVTDFLLFYIGSYPFPIFNVADIAITCGTILLAVYLLFIYKEPAKKHPETKDAK
jgi:signal peptidase II